MKLTIVGQTPSKKTSQSIIVNKKTNRPMVIPNRLYNAWIKGAIAQLQAHFHGNTFTCDMHVRFIVFRWSRRRADLINILQSLQDALQASGVIEDDFQIKSVDGSRLYLGVPKEEARALIEIMPADPY